MKSSLRFFHFITVLWSTLLILMSIHSQGQASISGPTCVLSGVYYSYTISANYSGTSNFNYVIIGAGVLSTGGTTGVHSGPGVANVMVKWTSTGGAIVLTGPAGSATHSVSITSTGLSGGSITSSLYQAINYNTLPSGFTCTAASGGSCGTANYQYQWQQSTDQVNYSNISGATGVNYSPGPLTQTIYLRRFVQESTSGNTAYSSNVAMIDVYPLLTGGSVSPSSQSINYQANAATLTVSGISGGTNFYTYQWQSAPDNATWTNIGGATNSSYTPSALSATTYFRMAVSSNGVTAYSAGSLVTVYPPLLAGTLGAAQTINYNSIPAMLMTSGASGGNGSYSYQWYSSSDNTAWTAISGQTGISYSPPALTAGTYYKVAVTSNGASTNTASVLITVYPQLSAGTVQAGPAINYNTVPGQLTLSGVSGGNGVYSYQWYVSTNGGSSWTSIPGATMNDYTPGALTTTTMYEAVVTSNGVQATSGPGTVTVYPPLTAGSINPAGQAINYNTAPSSLNVGGISGGSGSYTYQWQSASSATGPFTPLSGATAGSYNPPVLTATTYFEVSITSNGASVTSTPVVVNVYPPLVAGAIAPSSLTLPPGASPGFLTSEPASGGNGVYSYQWQSSSDGSNFSNIAGAMSLVYNPGTQGTTTWYRLVVTSNGVTGYSALTELSIGTATTNLNYIRTRTLSRPGVTDTVTADGLTSPYDVQQSTTYIDGLGRMVQTVAMQASPLQHDIVTVNVYDPYGREAIHYMPYASPSNDGNYKPDAIGEQSAFNSAQFPNDQFYYGQTDFEASALSRVLQTYAPGNSWVGSGRGVGQQYLVNTPADSVHLWNIAFSPGSLPTDGGLYVAGTLYKNVTVDEQDNQVIEYKDLEGQVVLKKVQLASAPGTAHVGWLCTYYVYDDLNLLRFVLPPRAVELINTGSSWSVPQTVADGLCFRYEYDQRNRMIIKKVPGAGEVHMVYDGRDRLVMSQDANQRAQQKWLFTCYDGLDRPDSTGLMTDPANYNKLTYHEGLAMQGLPYPNLAGYTTELLTQTFYDGYTGISAASGLPAAMATGITSSINNFITSYNNGPIYAVAPTPQPITRGLVTGTMTEVLGTSGKYLFTESFYDDRGRAIQTQSLNYTGGVDTLTTQYDFSGKPLRTLLGQAKLNNTAQYHVVVTKTNYDPNFRVTSIYKNIDGSATDQLVDSMQYDELGQLRAKYLGKDPATGNFLDSLVYAYNIRGWLTGINPNYVGGSTTNYFGMELAYDKTSSVIGTTSYLTPSYNGNIAGTIWKSAGDRVGRKYDFSYDAANRLLGAAYQDNKAGSWGKTKMDFTVSGLGYDANGNILSMNQNGFKLGSPSGAIDQLTYAYPAGSNQLAGVMDGANDPNSTLGDFHYPASKQSGGTDYTYDGNGNLITDGNKGVDTLAYNYLNLPQRIHMKGKGDILYTYDASGDKLVKQTIDSASGLTTTTLYLDGFQYQRRAPAAASGSGVDTLQFAAHEEGRARWAFHKHLAGDSVYGWEYDFAEKDHLGDTRVLLTQEKDTAQYLCTLDASSRTTENTLFYNIDSTSYSSTEIPGFPNPSPADSLARLNGNGPKVGPAIILKVMSGDKVDLGVQYYYNGQGATSGAGLSPASLLNALASGLTGMSASAGEALPTLSSPTTSPLLAALTSSIGNQTDTGTAATGKPQAYLNWMLLDNQFNYVGGNNQSGALQVGGAGTQSSGQLQQPLAMTGIPINTSGYLYIYVSNATRGWDVFFDNLSVRHYSGPMVEEDHYYPFGLTMAGISDKAVKTNYVENKYRFNKGSELQNKEFSDGSGLEMYETHLRELDPQLGRWWQFDPKSKLGESPYVSMGNNPILRNDPLGDTAAYFRPDGSFWKFSDDGKKTFSGVFFQKSTVTSTYEKDGVKYEVTQYSKGLNFAFNDPKNDVQAIKNGVINRVQIMTDGDISKQIDRSGVNSDAAQNSPLSYAKSQGVASGKMDYAIQGASAGDLNKNTFYLYNNNSNAPIGTPDSYTGYNIGDFGNFLWGWGMATLGIGNDAAAAGAQYNQIFNGRRGNDKTDLFDFGPGTYGDPGWFDSPDDQQAIQDGWNASPRGRLMSANLLNVSKN
jgi:RHS repeat-associated protein